MLFEIGRAGLAELAAASGGAQASAEVGAGPRSAASVAAQTAATTRQAETRLTYAVLAGVVFLGLGVMMVVGRPGPAMLAAQRWWSSTAAIVPAAAGEEEPAACSHPSTIIVAMLQAAALGFAAGVVVELGAPGSVGPFGVILFAAATAAFFWAFLYPGTRWVRDFRAGMPRGRRWGRVMVQGVLFVAAVVRLAGGCAAHRR